MACRNCGKNKSFIAPKTERDKRRDVCRKCEYSDKRFNRDGTVGLIPFSKCGSCKCEINTLIASGDCPLGKWTL